MPPEGPPKPAEREKVYPMSKEQFERLSSLNTEDSDDLAFMRMLGIEFNSGDINIKIDGEKAIMTTRKDDFGTLLTPETIEKTYGAGKRNEIYPRDHSIPSSL